MQEAVLMQELAIILSIVIAAVIVAFALRYETVFNIGGVLQHARNHLSQFGRIIRIEVSGNDLWTDVV